MVLSIPISPEVEEKLKAKAAVAGVDVQTFVVLTLQRAATRPSLEDLLAPLCAEFNSSGMSEDELTALLETAKHELRESRQSQGGDHA
jgi:hypothetical protein